MKYDPLFYRQFIVVGNAGREHKVADSLVKSPNVQSVGIAPGNAGTKQLFRGKELIGQNLPFGADDHEAIIRFAYDKKYTVVVGREEHLEKGLVDQCNEAGVPAFGPSQKAARIESDRAWSVDFMKRHNIPHALSRAFSDYASAAHFIDSGDFGHQLVVKWNYLAGGKGAEVLDTKKEAKESVKDMLSGGRFASDDPKIVIQKRLYGPELSLIVLSDGKNAYPLQIAQDNKRIFDGDLGPNTGGIAAYCPMRLIPPQTIEDIMQRIIYPAIRGMAEEGALFKGALYAGLMFPTLDDPQIIEFNARFGDPETQVQLEQLYPTQFAEIINATIHGGLQKEMFRFRQGASACIVLSSQGYPGEYGTGEEIFGLEKDYGRDITIIHAGTQEKDGKVVTDGGRVLGILAHSSLVKGSEELTLIRAVERARSVIGGEGVHFEGMQYRTDLVEKIRSQLK